MQVYWIAALGFGIAIALFAVQNSTPVPISFLWFGVEAVPVSVLVLICAALGALVTGLFGLGREIRMRVSRRSSRRTVRAQEQRIAELENDVGRLEREKAELQGRLDALQGRTGETAAERGPGEALPASHSPLPLPPGEGDAPGRAP
jgi:putative membrane protein